MSLKSLDTAGCWQRGINRFVQDCQAEFAAAFLVWAGRSRVEKFSLSGTAKGNKYIIGNFVRLISTMHRLTEELFTDFGARTKQTTRRNAYTHPMPATPSTSGLKKYHNSEPVDYNKYNLITNQSSLDDRINHLLEEKFDKVKLIRTTANYDVIEKRVIKGCTVAKFLNIIGNEENRIDDAVRVSYDNTGIVIRGDQKERITIKVRIFIPSTVQTLMKKRLVQLYGDKITFEDNIKSSRDN